MLHGIEVTNPSEQVYIRGDHLPGQSNGLVRSVMIMASNTPFMIPQIFTTFPNLIDLEVHRSNLQTISFPSALQLESLTVHRNNVSRIVNGTFSGLQRLKTLNISESYVREIEAGAFAGATNIRLIDLSQNNITAILPPTFQSLTNLVYADLHDNLLTEMRCGIFGLNTNLQTLLLHENQINATCTMFSRRLSPTVTFLDMSNNVCINRSFLLGDELGLISLNNALNPCFNNFNNEVPELRKITMEFRGPIALYDEFGNIIARIN